MWILALKYRLSGLETCTSRGLKNDDFSFFADLGGDFYKETHAAKLFGMHIGSVLSGLDAGNVNTDSKISIVGFGDVSFSTFHTHTFPTPNISKIDILGSVFTFSARST